MEAKASGEGLPDVVNKALGDESLCLQPAHVLPRMNDDWGSTVATFVIMRLKGTRKMMKQEDKSSWIPRDFVELP